MIDVHFTPGQKVSFPFEGKECVGEVDIHQRAAGWVMIKAELNHKWARLVAIRDSQVKAI